MLPSLQNTIPKSLQGKFHLTGPSVLYAELWQSFTEEPFQGEGTPSSFRQQERLNFVHLPRENFSSGQVSDTMEGTGGKCWEQHPRLLTLPHNQHLGVFHEIFSFQAATNQSWLTGTRQAMPSLFLHTQIKTGKVTQAFSRSKLIFHDFALFPRPQCSAINLSPVLKPD